VEWDGRWLVLLVSVPEAQRDLRHRIRTQLNWAGFGSPAAGVWVSPHASRQAEGQRILAEAGMDGAAMSFIAGYGQIASQDMLVARSWDLGALEQSYEDFIERVHRTRPADRRGRVARRFGWCTNGGAFRSSTPACRPGYSPAVGAAPRPPTCSTPGTPTGIRPPSGTGSA
jgi:hypothetical protein